MNPFGSYRRLLGNSVAAMSAAIEIYNKPKIEYRDETFVILLVNAWELALKALLSKDRQRIYYKKRRNEPYRTLSITDALRHCEKLFPSRIDYGATVANLEQLITFRDNAIHFYGDKGMGVIIYALAQTAIVNYKDLLQDAFDRDLAQEITLSLLPLALSAPADPVAFLNAEPGTSKTSEATRQFHEGLRQVVGELEADNRDTGRFMTIFSVSLQSTKKVASSDFIVGVEGASGGGRPILVQQRVDPNKSYPYRRMDIISSLSDPYQQGMGLVIGGHKLTSHVFERIMRFYGFKDEEKYCWREETGAITKYSQSLVERLKTMTKKDVDVAMNAD